MPPSSISRLLADQSASGENDNKDGAIRRDLPIRRNMHEGKERRRGQRQRQRANHSADGRDAAADELAAQMQGRYRRKVCAEEQAAVYWSAEVDTPD
jgi:hypothetical protein